MNAVERSNRKEKNSRSFFFIKYYVRTKEKGITHSHVMLFNFRSCEHNFDFFVVVFLLLW